MDLQLKGKRALVIGASRGLGYAVANTLAAEGCRVAINSRNAEKLSASAKKIADLHDIAKSGACRPLIPEHAVH